MEKAIPKQLPAGVDVKKVEAQAASASNTMYGFIAI